MNNKEYEVNYILNYSNFMQIINELKKDYKTILKLQAIQIQPEVLIDTYTYDACVDSTDVYNWLKEVAYYNSNVLECDVLCVDHFGTSWDYVLTSVELVDNVDDYIKTMKGNKRK